MSEQPLRSGKDRGMGSALAGFSGVEYVNGGSGNDILIGDTAANVLGSD